MKNKPTKPISTFPKSQWKIWFWGVILFVAVFIGIKEVPKLRKKTPAEETLSFDKVDALPSFPAGEKAFGNYLEQNINAETGTKGRVIASFVVDKNGSLTNVRILRSLNNQADEEMVRVLEKSPKWIPGRKDGKAVM